MNWKRGFRRITICAAVVTGLICSIFSVGLIIYIHTDAQNYLKWEQDNYISKYNPCKLENVTEEHGSKKKYKCMNILEFRQKYPSYDDMSDSQLASRIHTKYYSDVPYTEFAVAFLGIVEPPDGFELEKFEYTPKNFVEKSITQEEALTELLRKKEEIIEKEGAKERLSELKKGFWVTLSTPGFVGICVSIGLVTAVVGFCVIWLIYFFVEWIILGFAEVKSIDL